MPYLTPREIAYINTPDPALEKEWSDSMADDTTTAIRARVDAYINARPGRGTSEDVHAMNEFWANAERDVPVLLDALAARDARIAELTAALRIYADDGNWSMQEEWSPADNRPWEPASAVAVRALTEIGAAQNPPMRELPSYTYAAPLCLDQDRGGAVAARDARIAEMKVMAERLEAALERFVDDDPCRHDQHGFCQAHGLSQPCRMVQARLALVALRHGGGARAW